MNIYEIAPIRGVTKAACPGGHSATPTLKDDPNTITVLAGDFVRPSLIAPSTTADPVTAEKKIAGPAHDRSPE